MYVYSGEMKVKPQHYDANLQQKPITVLQLQAARTANIPKSSSSSRFPTLSDYGALYLNEFEYMKVDAAACTTDRLIYPPIMGGKLPCGSTASLRLQPHLYSNQQRLASVLKKQSAESNYDKPRDIYENTEGEENTVVKQNDAYKNVSIDNNDLIGDAQQITCYATTVQNRRYSAMSPCDYTKFNDYDGSYNDKYTSQHDNLSPCSDIPAYTTTTAHNQYLQQQRKYAIMMAMTTASVIASGETRLPVQRITDSSKLTIFDQSTECINSVQGQKLNELDNYNSKNIDCIIRDLQNSVSIFEPELVTETIPFTTSPTSRAEVKISNEKKRIKLQPESPPLFTRTKKLPKRLPTPKYNINNSHGKIYANAKKLPQLPVDNRQSDNSNGETYFTLNDSPKEQCTTGTLTGTGKVNTNTSLKNISTGLLSDGKSSSLAVDSFGDPSLLSSFVLSPFPATLTKTTKVGHSPLYQETYLTHLADHRNLAKTGVANNCPIDTYLASIQPYTPVLPEEMVSSATKVLDVTTLSSLSTSSQTKGDTYDNRNHSLTSNSTKDTLLVKTITSGRAFVDSQRTSYILNCDSNSLKVDSLSGSNNNSNFAKCYLPTINSSFMTSSTRSELRFYLKQDAKTSSKDSINANNDASPRSNFLHATSLPPLYTYIALPTTATSIIETATTSTTTTAIAVDQPLPELAASFPAIAFDFTSSSRRYSYISGLNEKNSYPASSSGNVCKLLANTYTTSGAFDALIFDTYYKHDIRSSFTPPTASFTTVTNSSSLATTAEYESSMVPKLPLTTFIATEEVINIFSKNDIFNASTSPTSTAVLVNERNGSLGQLIATDFETAEKAQSTTSSKTIVTLAATTTTSFLDYFTPYKNPVNLTLETCKNNNSARITNSISSEISSNLAENINFFICDKSVTETNCHSSSPLNQETYFERNLAFINVPSNTSLPNEAPIATDNYTVNTSSTENIVNVDDLFPQATSAVIKIEKNLENDIFAVAISPTTLTKDTKYDNVVTTMSGSSQKNTINDIFPAYITKATVSETDTSLFSTHYPPDANPSVGDNDESKFISVGTTDLPLRSAFNGNLYDSYNRLQSKKVVEVDSNAETPSLLTSNMASFKEIDVEAIGLLKTKMPSNSVISNIPKEISSATDNSIYCSVPEDSISTKPIYKTVAAPTPTNILTEANASPEVSGKPTSMFGGISKGIKTGLDGVLGGVNNVVATTDSRVKEQQKKINLGFGIAYKYVPNVGGLIAGAKDAVQQASMIRVDQSSTEAFITSAATTTATYKNVYPSNSEIKDGICSNDGCEHLLCSKSNSSLIDQFSEPTYTKSCITVFEPFHISESAQNNFSDNNTTSNSIHSNVCGGSEDGSFDYNNVLYIHKEGVSSQNPHIDGKLDFIKYHGYPPETILTTGILDSNNIQFSTSPKPQQNKEIQTNLLHLTSGTSFDVNARGDLASEITKLPPPSIAEIVPSSGRNGVNGSMICSLLGKAAAAVQSATQAVNQVTTAVQQKTSLATSTEAMWVSTIELGNKKSVGETNQNGSSQLSGAISNGTDVENSRLYYYENSVIATPDVTRTAEVDLIVTPQYCLNDNQNRQQSGKILPTVPHAAFVGKKLPTINTNNVGFLIKQHPSEVSDGKVSITDVTQSNKFDLIGNDNELFDDDESINDVADNGIYNIDCDKLENFFVVDIFHSNQNIKPQQLHPNSEIDSEQPNNYTKAQNQTNAPDSQQNSLSQYQQQFVHSNNYCKNFDGGYNYQEDYFNEEDEYKYLAKEQELLFKQHHHLEAVKQQHPEQLELICKNGVAQELYLEDDYESEFNDNYMEEELSCSISAEMLNAKTNLRNQLKVAKQMKPVTENDGATTSEHFISPSVISEVILATSRASNSTENALLLVTYPQQKIKKQGSILIDEEGNTNILFNERDVMTNNALTVNQALSQKRKTSQEPIHQVNESRIAELPLLTIATTKKVLKRGETEEVVGGDIHIIRKQEITAKQRWHWAYNKIIIQLNVSRIN